MIIAKTKFQYLAAFFLFVCSAYPNQLKAQENTLTDSVIIINGVDAMEMAGEKIYFLEDTEGTLGIEDILKPENQGLFVKNDKPVFVRTPTDKTYWLKMVVLNQSEEDLYIEVGSEFFRHLDYYVENKGTYKHLAETGFMRPSENRPYPVNLYWLKLEKSKLPQTIYLKLDRILNFEVPIQIGTLTQLYHHKEKIDAIFYGFMGILLIMFGYNFFLYLSIKDNVYVFYLGYLLVVSVTIPFAHSYTFITYIFGEAFRAYLIMHVYVWYNVFFLFAGLFIIRFLDLRSKSKFFYYLSIGFMTILCLLIPLANLLEILPFYRIHTLNSIFSLGFSLIALILGIYLWLYKKESQAKFYFFGWIWIIICTFIAAFTFSGILPYHYLTRNAQFFGFCLEILFFSLALGDRFSRLRRENLRILENQKQELEIQVIERTTQLRESNEEVKIKSEALEEQNREILDSISYAQRIQQSILPLAEDISKQVEEYFILFKPRDIVSGDFYYFQPVNNKIILAVVDCTGHGVPGAFMSMLGKEILDNIILERKILEADMIVNELHKGIRKALKQDQTENRDGMDLSLIVLHKEAQYLEFTGAKNSLIYISDNQLHEIKGDKMAVGGEQKESERLFTKHQVNISSNTTCYLFSDGYQDQFGGKEKKKFMVSRMRELLLEIHRLPMEEQRQILDLKIEDWMTDGGERQIDDILMMGVRV